MVNPLCIAVIKRICPFNPPPPPLSVTSSLRNVLKLTLAIVSLSKCPVPSILSIIGTIHIVQYHSSANGLDSLRPQSIDFIALWGLSFNCQTVLVWPMARFSVDETFAIDLLSLGRKVLTCVLAWLASLAKKRKKEEAKKKRKRSILSYVAVFVLRLARPTQFSRTLRLLTPIAVYHCCSSRYS